MGSIKFKLFFNCYYYFVPACPCWYSYSLAQTELFLRSLLDEEPAKNVVAPEAPQCDHHRAASKEREKVFQHRECWVACPWCATVRKENAYLSAL